MKKILTVKEFIDLVNSSDTKKKKSTFILTHHDGKFRCETTVDKVHDLKWNEEKGVLEWGDDNGDPFLRTLTLETKMNKVTYDGDWLTTVYTKE